MYIESTTLQLLPVGIVITVAAIMFTVLGGFALLSQLYSLNNIKSRTVGDGQHGTAQWATKSEISKTYLRVTYDVANWRNGNNLPTEQGLVVGSVTHRGVVSGLVDTGDVHCLMIGAAGIGKTAYFLYPNLEYACASGMSFVCTDTKGDLFRNYASIAKEWYGYNVAILDLRNPTCSDGNNLLSLVNSYMDSYRQDSNNLAAKAKAEKYAKIISKTVVNSGDESYGQNQFFYDAAEGLLTSVILMLAEYVPPRSIDSELTELRHIVSVYKLIQDLMDSSAKTANGKTAFHEVVDMLPPNHKARWFAGAAINSTGQSFSSVASTVLSRLNSFIDTELEQVLCFDSQINAERFCREKSAIFIVLPEEDATKYFMVSLFLQQFYRELLTVADEHGGKLPRRVMIYADEIGTIPKIESFEMMLSAGRSRRISVVPIIQSFAQLEKTYGKEGSQIITDNCQLTLFGGFAPNSESAMKLSAALGNRTVLSGSVTRGKSEPSQSLQMTERPLMSADELKALPKGNFIVTKTGRNPMRTVLKLFLDWGITFGEPYKVPENAHRTIHYANKEQLELGIIMQVSGCGEDEASILRSIAAAHATKPRRQGGQAGTAGNELVQGRGNTPTNVDLRPSPKGMETVP